MCETAGVQKTQFYSTRMSSEKKYIESKIAVTRKIDVKTPSLA